MRNHDAGHNHLKTAYFVADCPLCDAEKAARNQGIAHLSEALKMLEHVRPEGVQPTIRMNVGPVDLTRDGADHCHSIDLTAKQAEALADAIDSMNAYLGSEAPVDQGLRNLADRIRATVEIDETRLARFKERIQGQPGEALESDEFSADTIGKKDPELVAEITDLFTELDLVQITKEVLDDPQAHALTVTLALDSWFGEIADPAAEEDDA
ncbi:hypothetical protein [Streptomyces sp. NPDC093269]|uniref:hypothetical protein n=1 Tax=Streptomyces sp. NPDC093269 TaxID=3366038 RepID=UPI00381614DF